MRFIQLYHRDWDDHTSQRRHRDQGEGSGPGLGVSVHDLHATMLYLLGIDHTRLTFKLAGRDFRLTDVRGDVVKRVLA